MERQTATDRLSYINTKAGFLELSLYLIIDEYDNFTNIILPTARKPPKRLPTARLSTDPQFNGIIGFSETELRTLLQYYKDEGTLTAEVEELITIMKPWYDNYCFAKNSLGESMYNSDMVLYFLNYFLRLGILPEEMIDKNIHTDYNKIRHLIRMDRELGMNFSVIREVIETGRTLGRIKDSFSVLEMVDPNNFKSLLYYFGLLTISGVERGNVVLSIPNQAVREQLYTYLIDAYQ